MLHAARLFVSLLFLLIFLSLSRYSSSLSQDNRLIHSTYYKIILSTQPYPFSTCQIKPCFHYKARVICCPKELIRNAHPTLGNALFSTLFRYSILYFWHQYYALNVKFLGYFHCCDKIHQNPFLSRFLLTSNLHF